MTPKEVKKYYKSQYNFREQTGMSAATLGNWLKWDFVPLKSQVKLEALTNGALKAEWHHKIKGG
jgi:hypothetical protein